MKQTWNGNRKKLESAHTVSSRQDFSMESLLVMRRFTTAIPMLRNYTYLGTVESIDENGRSVFEQKNKFTVGETIERMKPDGTNVSLKVIGIFDEDGNAQESAPHPKQMLHVVFDGETEPQDILRRQEPDEKTVMEGHKNGYNENTAV